MEGRRGRADWGKSKIPATRACIDVHRQSRGCWGKRMSIFTRAGLLLGVFLIWGEGNAKASDTVRPHHSGTLICTSAYQCSWFFYPPFQINLRNHSWCRKFIHLNAAKSGLSLLLLLHDNKGMCVADSPCQHPLLSPAFTNYFLKIMINHLLTSATLSFWSKFPIFLSCLSSSVLISSDLPEMFCRLKSHLISHEMLPIQIVILHGGELGHKMMRNCKTD